MQNSCAPGSARALEKTWGLIVIRWGLAGWVDEAVLDVGNGVAIAVIAALDRLDGLTN